MLDTLTSENYRDFSPRYSHTYGWLQQEGTKQLVYIRRVTDDRVYFTNQTNMEYHAKINSGVMFEFIPVDHGWFNGQDGVAYFLSRMPSRQWKRGISDSNTSMVSSTNMRAMEITYNGLANIFNVGFESRNYPKLFSGVGALSKHFAIAQTGRLYMYDRWIGTYKDGVITLFSDLVKQELTDLINRNGWNIQINVSES